MVKKIIKESIIFLLLILAIILILGILLYDYVPANKIIPEKISYMTPEKVQQELQVQEELEDTEVVITYQLDATDLNNYQNIKEYVPGKKNPFEDVKEEPIGTEDNTITEKNEISTDKNQNSSNTGYLPEKGTK